MIKLYLDTCIFVADFDKDDDKHDAVKEMLKKICKLKNITLVTSDFTFTETVKVLIKEKDVGSSRAHEYAHRTHRSKKIQGVPFKILRTEGRVPRGTIFDFYDFFLAIQDELLDSRSSIADAIHTVVMRNNKVKRILSFNGDFDNIRGITRIKPEEIDEFLNEMRRR